MARTPAPREPARKPGAKPTAPKRAKRPAPATTPTRSTRADTKCAQVIALLSTTKGASIAELTAATGWQAHSVRGVISGVLRKKLGLAVQSEAIDGVRRYRIAA